MERMWRKVNHSFSGRTSKTASTTVQSTDTVSSAGGFGDGQIVVAVAGIPGHNNNNSGNAGGGNLPSSTATGRRLAASGQVAVPGADSGQTTGKFQKSLSQHVLLNSTASSERRRRRRRKSRPRRSGGVSCVSGGGGDNMSSSGGFYSIRESSGGSNRRRHHHQQQSTSQLLASSAPSGTVMMYPNPSNNEAAGSTAAAAAAGTSATATAQTGASTGASDISLRQRAVAKLRMFNFHLNWDLHMTHCKPCGPRIGSSNSGGGNIITRRLCRNRRREDNELYRSNSFKFERFERKEVLDELSDTLQKQIAICDDYSLPVDFVKKRPSSFDPNLAEALPTNPENWTVPSPQTEFIPLADPQLQQQQYQGPPPPPLPASNAATTSVNAAQSLIGPTAATAAIHTLPIQTQHQHQHLHQQQGQQHHQQQHHSVQLRSHKPRRQQQHPPLPNTAIKHASVKLIEGYSDPKDSKRQKKVYHKKAKRRQTNNNKKQQQKQQQQQQQPQDEPVKPQNRSNNKHNNNTNNNEKDKRSNYSSDSSGPKSSDDEAETVGTQSIKVPELNSPDSISDDLVRPLPPQSLHRSPRKLTAGPSETSKRNPSPYYYSDLLKPKETSAVDKEAKLKSRQSTASEPPQLTQAPVPAAAYRKSTSLDVPERTEQLEPLDNDYIKEYHNNDNVHDNNDDDDVDEEDEDADNDEDDEFEEETEPTTHNTVLAANSTPKRYSFTEDGVRIIRCDSPSTSTSDDSDCSECQKRREWHARALALVRKTCNVKPLISAAAPSVGDSEVLKLVPSFEAETSMPPHRLLGPAVCACVAPSTIGDDIDEYFRPRSIFYVHPHGVHECVDCSLDAKHLNKGSSSRSILDASSLAQSDNALDEEDDDDEDDEMTGRRRQIYETAFDCKIAKSDDDLDEVDRITNHSVLLQLNNGNNLPAKSETRNSKSSHSKSRLEGKRLKNSKNQAIQEKASNSGSSGSPRLNTIDNVDSVNVEAIESCINNLATNLDHVHIRDHKVDQQNNSTTSTSLLPMRGYTPSPPSTAPLPMKFPGKHDRFFMNSIKSAPNLPSTNPAHPRLRDLRLPIQSTLRQQQQLAGSSLGTSNENSLTDSAYANPPSSTHHLPPTKSTSRTRDRPRSFVLESGRVLELRKSHAAHHHHVGNGGRRQHNYSSTESIATSSSGGSMESLRSSTSEGNRSTSSSESRHSTSLSSHSSESGSSSAAFPLRAPVVIHSKLHILSPISDKSSQEPGSELSDQNKTQNATPEELIQHHPQPVTNSENARPAAQLHIDALKRRRAAPNKTLQHLADEILGSDSGISLHSREDGKSAALTMGLQKFTLPKLNFPPSDKTNDSGISAVGGISGSVGLPQDLRDLPFDMPKLRRRKTLQQDACTSGSATSVDLGDLPFDMPKLRRRLRANQVEINNLMVHSTESSGISQASSSHSMREENKANLKLDANIFRQNLTLNLNEQRPVNKFGSLDLRGMSSNKELNLNLMTGVSTAVDLIDVSIPLERQGWYHGAITRIEAETTLRPLNEGSFLVRNCESTKQDYSLSLKGAKGFMHMRIQRNEGGQYILGQFSRPFDTVPEMIRHFCLNRLPVRGAEHMCLIEPVIAQLL